MRVRKPKQSSIACMPVAPRARRSRATYRQKARRDYLRVAKSKKPRSQKLRQGIGKQLRYLRRNLGTIVGLAQEGLLLTLPKKRYRQLLVIQGSFLVMNVEHLLVRVGSLFFFACWPSWRSPRNGLLVARWLKRKTDYRDRRLR